MRKTDRITWGLILSLAGCLWGEYRARADSIVQITAEAQGLEQVSLDACPHFGTYWWAEPNAILVPAPCPPFDPTLPVYAITDDQFLIDSTAGVLPRAASVAAAMEVESNAVVNLINQVQGRVIVRTMALASGISIASADGETGTSDAATNSFISNVQDFGTNLWIAQTASVSGAITGFASNTLADVYYEIQSKTNLLQTGWQSEGFIPGSELTNWTALGVAQNGRPILFLRLRSWLDTYDIGIPDWWQIEYFGTNGIDPDASAAGDGYSNLEKFEMGLNPTNYYNTNALPGFFGALDLTGTSVVLNWSNAPGPVVNYLVQRGVYNSLSGLYNYSQIGTSSSNVLFFNELGTITNSNASNNIYTVTAAYPGGAFSGTNQWLVSWYGQYGALGIPYGPPLPTNVYAYADTTATNVFVAWQSTSGLATNYLIERGISNAITGQMNYFPIAYANTNAGSFEVLNPFTNGDNWADCYAVSAVYPGGGLSVAVVSPIHIGFTNGLTGPTGFYGYMDSTGTNVFLTWNSAAGTPVHYTIFGGTNDAATGGVGYIALGQTSGSTNLFEVAGGVAGNGNNLYDIYSIFAVYADGSFSQATNWAAADGTPAPSGFVAYLDNTGTNVLLAWDATTNAITGYTIYRQDPNDFLEFDFGSNGTLYEDTNAINTGSFDINSTIYYLKANYLHGGTSGMAEAAVTANPPTPTNFSTAVDSSGTNVVLTWSVANGAATSYTIWRGVWDASTSSYVYSAIATVGAGVSSYTDSGSIAAKSAYNDSYRISATYHGGVTSTYMSSILSGSSASSSTNQPTKNVYFTAQLVRNENSRWQIMFSGLPTNQVSTIRLTWALEFHYYIVGEQTLEPASITNNVYVVPDADAVSFNGDLLTITLFDTSGNTIQETTSGYIADDAPYFVDGRRHMKQNLKFLIRGAAINQLFCNYYNIGTSKLGSQCNSSSTNFEEFSFLLHGGEDGGAEELEYFQLDNLWPFSANYGFANYLVDTTRTNANLHVIGITNFTFVPDFTTNIPAPAILATSDPYWILQDGLAVYLSSFGGCSPMTWGLNISDSNTYAFLNTGRNNFGLKYNNGCIVCGAMFSLQPFTYQSISPGDGLAVADNYFIRDYASWTPEPTLLPINYYFAALANPKQDSNLKSGVNLPGESKQLSPVPIEDDFNITNQTPLLIGSIGQPMVIAGWQKYSIKESSPAKYAYLGQYFITNIMLLDDNGTIMTNSAGIMSPYGEFFPLQAGTAQFRTMPDIDNPSQQGTGVVSVISLNADANHDGTLDLSYAGPDFVSSSKPFRFWINDNQDSGDYGGDGVPGQGTEADGVTQMCYGGPELGSFWAIHGRRDLVDYFPVYLNIGGLFQSNSFSAGISPADTNYSFVLSQSDGALRFAYTGLTPTNYMNFLQDTTVSSNLAYATLTTISNAGVSLYQSFLAGIATNNEGIILVEAWTDTTEPLVLTIYHGTNQIAQTSLYLSISGVEQMFRHKNLMLNPNDTAPGDRLTDASVPNEPDTIDKNFVFLHGYNVNTNEARGVAADMYKRMFWSGSHAKFYAVTWQGADTKGTYPFYNLLTPNYHTNVVNAFLTAPLLANFIATLTKSGPVVAAAHSLGNMVTLSAISDWNAPISQYFMLDAAVPMEAIDSSVSTNVMVLSAWLAYSNRLYASDWWQLFPTNDARSTLAWNNRLGNLGSVDVYNFYSSGEDVLRADNDDPPFDFSTVLDTQLADSAIEGVPFGTYAWVWQEKGKGVSTEDWLVGSSHGGWKFSTYWVTGGILGGSPLSPAIMNNTATNILQSQPMFDFNSTANNFLLDVDSELLGSVPGVDPSTYAKAYRNRILSDAIPAVSLPAGANPVPFFAANHNIDMMTLESGWPQGRLHSREGSNWHHSDYHVVAYTYTHQLFNTFVTLGNLK